MQYEEDKVRHPGKTARDRASGSLDEHGNVVTQYKIWDW